MGTFLLVIHLMIAIFLVCVILLQRSTGGALEGLGGGSGASSFMTARGKGNLLTRTTAILATLFICTSIALSLYYKDAGGAKGGSIMEQAPAQEQPLPDAPTAPVAK